MYTELEEKQLQEFYSLISHPDGMISPDELNGLLFGLAITPEVVDPSEWFDDLFGDDPPTFPDSESRGKIQAYLMEMIRRRSECNRSGELTFPYDVEQSDGEDVELLFDWAYGFFAALTLRPDFWQLNRVEQTSKTALKEGDDPDPSDLLVMAISVVAAAALPEEMDAMIIEDQGSDQDENAGEETLEVVIRSLPFAVSILQEYGAGRKR